VNLRYVRERARRALPLALLAPVLPPKRLPERPVFVVGCPRSGTTVAFDLLRRSDGLASIGQEGHALWETFHGPWDHGWRSNTLGPGDVRWFERRYLAWAIDTLARPRMGPGHRFLDKTPRNALRLGYLDAVFPDASYVLVHRDGRAIVSSLLEAWRTRPIAAYRLPRPIVVDGRPLRDWHFVLPPGWSRLDGGRLEDVCAHQYVTCLEALLTFRDDLRARDPSRIVELRYEDVLLDPPGELQRVHQALDLPFTPGDAARARDGVRPPAGEEKWRTVTPGEIEHVMPRIAPTLERTGYGRRPTGDKPRPTDDGVGPH
jgi:hypothetical protein